MGAEVVRKRKSQAAIAGGHPWIFSGAIQSESGVEATTTRVVIRGATGEVMGHGWYSPQSQSRVRMYLRGGGEELEAMGSSLFAGRIGAARRRRARLGLPSEETTGFRVVNSEGDGIPGLVADLWGSSQAEDHPVVAGMGEGRYLSFVAGQLVRAPTL